MVFGLKKTDFKFTSLQTSIIQSLVDYELVVVVMVFSGVLLLASSNEFRTWMLCLGNSISLFISNEELTHGGNSEFIMLFFFLSFSFVVILDSTLYVEL